MPIAAADTERLTRLDHAHVWHPFTPMRQWRGRAPVIIERGEGFELIDTHGRRYIDGYSSLWCNVHGHRVPEIDTAIREQLDRVAHATMLGAATAPAIELAADLVGRCNAVEPATPGARLTKVFYTDAGATATEVALKMAAGFHHHRAGRGRDLFLAVAGGYHGDTMGAISVGFLPAMHGPYERFVFDVRRVPAPDPRAQAPTAGAAGEWPSWDRERGVAAVDAALAALDRALDEYGDRACALMIEPIMQGAGGMVAHPPGYLAGAVERCRSRGVLVIADEVATGIARTGAFLACDTERVRPDILCLAKGLSGGYLPLAATLCTEEIASAFEGEPHEHKTLYHGHTYTGNPLACAAAIASLELIDERGVVENARRLGGVIRDRLRAALACHPHVGDVRSRGVMTGIELVESRDPWAPFDPARGVGAEVCDEARRRGLMIRPLGDVVVLNPAPAMDEGTLGRALDLVLEAIDAVTRRPAGRPR